MLKAVKFAARRESASILGNRTGFSCNAPGKKLQHTNACSARVEQLLISWRAVAMRRRRFLFQLMDLLTERWLRDVLALRRIGEATLLCDSDKVSELMNLHRDDIPL